MSATEISMVGLQDTPHHLQRRRPWNRGLGQNASRSSQSRRACSSRDSKNRLGHSTLGCGSSTLGR